MLAVLGCCKLLLATRCSRKQYQAPLLCLPLLLLLLLLLQLLLQLLLLLLLLLIIKNNYNQNIIDNNKNNTNGYCCRFPSGDYHAYDDNEVCW